MSKNRPELLYEKRLLERIIIIVIAAVVILYSLYLYQQLVKETRALQWQLTAQYFLTGAATYKAALLIDIGNTGKLLPYHPDKQVYVSTLGWPLSTVRPVKEGVSPTPAESRWLWTQFLSPQEASSPVMLDAVLVNVSSNTCRYSSQLSEHYFDYNIHTGAIQIGEHTSSF